MSDRITVHAAKTNLSKLIARAEAGEEIIIYRGSKPAAKLMPIDDKPRILPNRGLGNLKGVIEFDERFFDPLPPHMMLKPTKKATKKSA